MNLRKVIIPLIIAISAIYVISSGFFSCGLLTKILYRNHGCLATLRSGGVAHIVFSPDSKLIATRSFFGTDLKIWRTDDKTLYKRWRPDESSSSFVFTPNSEQIMLATGQSGFVQFWDIDQEKVISEFDINSTQFALSPDGSTIAAQRLWEIRLWQISTQRLQQTINVLERFPPNNNAIQSVNFSPNGALMAVGLSDGSLRIYQVEDGSLLYRTNEVSGTAARNIIFSPDNRLVAVSNRDRVTLWDVEKKSMFQVMKGHGDLTWNLVFSPDGKYLISAGGFDGTLSIWRVEDGALVRFLQLTSPLNEVADFAISPDGKTLAASKRYGDVQLLDFETLIDQAEH